MATRPLREGESRQHVIQTIKGSAFTPNSYTTACTQRSCLSATMMFLQLLIVSVTLLATLGNIDAEDVYDFPWQVKYEWEDYRVHPVCDVSPWLSGVDGRSLGDSFNCTVCTHRAAVHSLTCFTQQWRVEFSNASSMLDTLIDVDATEMFTERMERWRVRSFNCVLFVALTTL